MRGFRHYVLCRKTDLSVSFRYCLFCIGSNGLSLVEYFSYSALGDFKPKVLNQASPLDSIQNGQCLNETERSIFPYLLEFIPASQKVGDSNWELRN